MPNYIVMLKPGFWLTDGEGDPPRTLKKNSAKVYESYGDAENALSKARALPYRNGYPDGVIQEIDPLPITPELLAADGWRGPTDSFKGVSFWKDIPRNNSIGVYIREGDEPMVSVFDNSYDGSSIPIQIQKTMPELKALYDILAGQALPPRVEWFYLPQLPDSLHPVIVSYKMDDFKPNTREGYFISDGNAWYIYGIGYIDDGKIENSGHTLEIIAWQPMPKPAPMQGAEPEPITTEKNPLLDDLVDAYSDMVASSSQRPSDFGASEKVG